MYACILGTPISTTVKKKKSQHFQVHPTNVYQQPLDVHKNQSVAVGTNTRCNYGDIIKNHPLFSGKYTIWESKSSSFIYPRKKVLKGHNTS